MRGTLIALKEAFIVLGMVVGFGVIALCDGTVDEHQQWRVSWAVPAVFALIILGIMYVAPPSPRWLVLRGQNAQAMEALRYLRPDASEVEVAMELEAMQAALAQHEPRVRSSTAAAAAPGDAEPLPPAAPPSWHPCSAEEQRKWAALGLARRPLVAGLGLILLQQITGQPTVLYYAQTIFVSSDGSHNAQLLPTAPSVPSPR